MFKRLRRVKAKLLGLTWTISFARGGLEEVDTYTLVQVKAKSLHGTMDKP